MIPRKQTHTCNRYFNNDKSKFLNHSIDWHWTKHPKW